MFWLQANLWRDESAAWPVANPVVTCATSSEAGFPSNFVADPFLYVQVNNSVHAKQILDFVFSYVFKFSPFATFFISLLLIIKL